MSETADELEAQARDATAQDAPQKALALLSEAMARRVATQGPDHPDLIWTLSLTIDAHLRQHAPENAAEAARLGERRLTLRRPLLAEAPRELAESLRELARLYVFEDDPFDADRRRALEAEADGPA